MSETVEEVGHYEVRPVTRDFISLTGGGIIKRPGYEVIFVGDDGAVSTTGCERLAKAPTPLLVGAARRAACAQMESYEDWRRRNGGRRFEVVEAEQRAAKRAAEKAEIEARKRVRAAAPDLLAALRDLVDVVESGLDAGLILSVDGKRPEIMALADARRALANAEDPMNDPLGDWHGRNE